MGRATPVCGEEIAMTLVQVRTDHRVKVATFSELQDRQPTHALVEEIDLVVVRYDDNVSVLYGRCAHRRALMSDGHVDGLNLICGVHMWDYRLDTGVSEYNNHEALHKFTAEIDEATDAVYIDLREVHAFAQKHPQEFKRDQYLGTYADIHGTPDEEKNGYIQSLARDGLTKVGHHGHASAMGIARRNLPSWDTLQLVTAQLATKPLLDDAPVGTDVVIGPSAKKPLTLKIPVFVSDMSFGALSAEAKTALAIGAERAGTGICSGEGGMLPAEQQANSRYFYELASAKFGWGLDRVAKCQAFHFKGGQGAKTGTGGHLPGAKVTGQIAEVRGLTPGTPAISPATFAELHTPADYRKIADEVREVTGGIPIGFKLSAQHIEADIDFALAIGVEYIILDGRGGGTGAAPNIFKHNISVPTIPALARARKHLDARRRGDVTLVITGGLRTESDFVKALALGADAVAIANSAMQAIGCVAMRACHTNNCPVGIATQKPHLRKRLEIERSATQLYNYLHATTELMQVLARACGHRHLNQFQVSDLTTYDRDMAYLAGVAYGGVTPL